MWVFSSLFAKMLCRMIWKWWVCLHQLRPTAKGWLKLAHGDERRAYLVCWIGVSHKCQVWKGTFDFVPPQWQKLHCSEGILFIRYCFSLEGDVSAAPFPLLRGHFSGCTDSLLNLGPCVKHPLLVLTLLCEPFLNGSSHSYWGQQIQLSDLHNN